MKVPFTINLDRRLHQLSAHVYRYQDFVRVCDTVRTTEPHDVCLQRPFVRVPSTLKVSLSLVFSCDRLLELQIWVDSYPFHELDYAKYRGKYEYRWHSPTWTYDGTSCCLKMSQGPTSDAWKWKPEYAVAHTLDSDNVFTLDSDLIRLKLDVNRHEIIEPAMCRESTGLV